MTSLWSHCINILLYVCMFWFVINELQPIQDKMEVTRYENHPYATGAGVVMKKQMLTTNYMLGV